MSYCVNCGVELAESEHKCPLCNTEVVNPRRPWVEPERRPYPPRVERLNSVSNRRYIGTLGTLLLLIPLLTVVFCDILANKQVTWSIYVAGGELVFFTVAILPTLIKKPLAVLCAIYDTLAVILYLSLIEALTGGEWMARLGFPISLVVGVCACGIVAVIASKKSGILVKSAVILMIIGLMTIGINVTLNLYRGLSYVLNWSVYVLIPCVVLGICLLILNGRSRFKDEMRRRFFI